ncbi:DUF4339 domain-containing protein [Clostridium sp.]|uniref:DUF4339 domain-containing protein n=1 Tax=Clostridium sp. TaxID=1506 RepID=UPI002620A746|nr:DUF4339 domain-containing protein [uncultured Clostridium sp.]
MGACDIVATAQSSLDEMRKKTNVSLEKLGQKKLEILADSMKQFIGQYEKIKNIDFKDSVGLDELKKLNFTGEALNDLKNASLNASKIMAGGAAALGTGVLTAFGAYSAVMTFGAASTGAAILGLSGVAATNATLAWLGGGSLAAGGGGMALGPAVLGGLVAGPALAIGGVIMSSQAKKKLNESYGNMEKAKVMQKEMQLAGTSLEAISVRADQITQLLEKINNYFMQGIANMKYIIEIEGTSWVNYSQSSKYAIFASTKIAQVIKAILDTSLIDEDGNLTVQSKQALIEGNKFYEGKNFHETTDDSSKNISIKGEGEEETCPPPIPQQQKWHIAINGQQEGPYDVSTIKSLIIKKSINREKCHVWKKGMPNWVLMGEVNEFIEIFNQLDDELPPPIPHSI